MSGLSRRGFLALTGGLAAAWSLPMARLGAALAEPLTPADVPTTLRETIRQQPTGNRQYRALATAPGEAPAPRYDLLGRTAEAARAGSRRSIAYLGHMSDMHVIDAQSPARCEPMSGFDASLFQGAIRPQDTLTVNVNAAMVAAMNAANRSPITGAPMAALVNTGDSADQHSNLELRWYIDVLDGVEITPNSGAVGEYEGPQIWPEANYAWHPDSPDGDAFGSYGFPTIPGLLTAAVSQTVRSEGLSVPWYSVFGNHDTLFYGTFPISEAMHALALGRTKYVDWEPFGVNWFNGFAHQPSMLTRAVHDLRTNFGFHSGARTVTSDSARSIFDTKAFMAEHFTTQQFPGPIGHGFTQENLDTGQTWWKADVGPNVRLFGLDTCNQVVGADGAVPQDQFDWLKAELEALRGTSIFGIVLSHHNSGTLENTAVPAIGPSQNLIHAEEFIDMLTQHPNLVAWLNGHTHINTIRAHPRSGGGGFWEITTASCIDFPQQQQTVEIVDNRDGTISLFTTVLDHLSPASWRQGDFSQEGLASLSRELASNDWIANPLMRLGSPLDRNTELLLPAPFDVSTITDASLERENAARIARLQAHDAGRSA